MYKRILFAVEFSKGAHIAEKKIKELCAKLQSNLSLIHIVEMPTIDPFPEIFNRICFTKL